MNSEAVAVVLALAVSACVMARDGGGEQTPAAPPSTTYAGFAFVSGDCGLGPDYCAVRQPRSWTAADISVVHEALDEIGTKPFGRSIIEQAQEKGYRMLRRYALGGTRDANGKAIPLPEADAQRHQAADGTFIDFNDLFFHYAGVRDRFSGDDGYRVGAKTLLHECLHAIDTWSSTPEFIAAAGFTNVNGRLLMVWEGTDDAVRARRLFLEQMERAKAAGDADEVTRLSREFALSMKPVRVPHMQATTSPGEAFAEIGAHLVLDDRARSYLPVTVVTYFDTQVFSTLRR